MKKVIYQKKRFRIKIIKIVQNPEKEWRSQTKMIQEIFNKDFKTEMKNTSEIKHALEGIKSRLTLAGKRINELEDRVMEITATEQNIF